MLAHCADGNPFALRGDNVIFLFFDSNTYHRIANFRVMDSVANDMTTISCTTENLSLHLRAVSDKNLCDQGRKLDVWGF